MIVTELAEALGLTPDMLIALSLPMLGALTLIIAAFAGGKEHERFKRRLKDVRRDSLSMRPLSKQTVNVKLSTTDSSIALLDRLIKQALPRREELRQRLTRTGLEISLGTYLTVCLFVAIISFTLIMLTGKLSIAAAAIAALAKGIALPHLATGLLAKRRQTKFIANFPEAIDLMTRGLKSGLPIHRIVRPPKDLGPLP